MLNNTKYDPKSRKGPQISSKYSDKYGNIKVSKKTPPKPLITNPHPAPDGQAN